MGIKMSETPVVPVYQLKTLDGRFFVMSQSVDRHQHPVVVVDVISIDGQRQATFKLGFKDIGNLRLALQTFGDAMLDGMCDY